ncbi:MAG TPA: type II and III secretion system protein family protein [Azospirillaceae bacterium]|nr:type II and III secretion system protein family protein [Azospirillaceae bacterium]
MRPFAAFALFLLAAFVGGILLVSPVRADVAMRQDEAAMAVELNKGTVLRLRTPAASVFVANPEVADVQVMSPTMVTVIGKGAGETTLVAVDGQDQVILNRRVTVIHNLSGLNRSLSELLPGERVSARSVQGGIVLTGSVASAEQAEDARRLAARFVAAETDVINRIAIEGPTQIHLRVRVAEVSRKVSKQFGINWEALGTSGNFLFGLARGPDILDAAGIIDRNGTLENLLLGFRTGSTDINVLIDALAEEGLISVLAEPSLTAMAGETASFLAGGEFPIPVAGKEGEIDIQFKQFGVSLAFTPTLSGAGRIGLRVRPEVSQLSAAGAIRINSLEIPALTTRRADTMVELGSGQSFAIAGLLQNNANQSVSKFPILGDMPVLGALFRSTRFQRDESELVIIVTPYLVEPSSTRLALPTDGLRHADDVEHRLEGRLVDRSSTGVPPFAKPGAAPAPVRTTPVAAAPAAGYIVK